MKGDYKRRLESGDSDSYVLLVHCFVISGCHFLTSNNSVPLSTQTTRQQSIKRKRPGTRIVHLIQSQWHPLHCSSCVFVTRADCITFIKSRQSHLQVITATLGWLDIIYQACKGNEKDYGKCYCRTHHPGTITLVLPLFVAHTFCVKLVGLWLIPRWMCCVLEVIKRW